MRRRAIFISSVCTPRVLSQEAVSNGVYRQSMKWIVLVIILLVAASLGIFLLAGGRYKQPTGSADLKENVQSGQVLAGKTALLYDFEKTRYEEAIKSDKLVVLYFYANWCPICKEELPRPYSAFDELSTDKVVGFRINYNDSQTDEDEKELARQFGVPYQHSKVFVKDRERILKAVETWDKQKYLEEIDKAI